MLVKKRTIKILKNIFHPRLKPTTNLWSKHEFAKSRAWRQSVLVRLYAHVLMCLRARMHVCLACLHALRAYVHSCLAWSRAYMLTCLACLLVLCPYVLTCFTCLLCSNILHAYVLACFFDINCPIFFAFEKLTSKNPYIEKFLFIQGSI